MPRRRKTLADVVPPTAFVCAHVAKGDPVLAAYRDEPIVSNDTGWQFTCGRPLARERKEPEMVLLEELLARDPSLRKVLRCAVGTALVRDSPEDEWTQLRDG